MSRKLLIGMACTLTACTTHLESSGPSQGISQGPSYHLPHLDYALDITRRVSACPTNHTGSIEFDLSAKAQGAIVPGEPIFIDYEPIGGPLKTADFELKNYPNGTLKSVNVTVVDRTAAVLSQAFKSVVSVGKIAIGLPRGSAASAVQDPSPQTFIACTKQVEESVAALPGLKAQIRGAEKAAKDAAKAAADFEADHKEAERAPDVVVTATRLATAKRVEQEKLDKLVEKLAETVASLTLSSRPTFTPRADETLGQNTLADARDGPMKPETMFEVRMPAGTKWVIIPLDSKLQLDVANARWSNVQDAGDAVALARALASDEEFPNLLAESFNPARVGITTRVLNPPSSAAGALNPASACSRSGKAGACGIIYRTRAFARTRICGYRKIGGVPDPNECATMPSSANGVLFSEDRAVPQLGRLASLPLRNRPFSTTTLTAVFLEDGGLSEVGYKKPTSEAEVAAGSLNEGLDALTGLITYGRGEDLRDLQYQKTIDDARASALASARALQPSEVTQVTNENSLLEQQIKRAELQIKLKKAEDELRALTEPPPTE